MWKRRTVSSTGSSQVRVPYPGRYLRKPATYGCHFEWHCPYLHNEATTRYLAILVRLAKTDGYSSIARSHDEANTILTKIAWRQVGNDNSHFHRMTSMITDDSWSGLVIFFKIMRDTTIVTMLYCSTETFWTGICCIHLTSTCIRYGQSCIQNRDTKRRFWSMYFLLWNYHPHDPDRRRQGLCSCSKLIDQGGVHDHCWVKNEVHRAIFEPIVFQKNLLLAGHCIFAIHISLYRHFLQLHLFISSSMTMPRDIHGHLSMDDDRLFYPQ